MTALFMFLLGLVLGVLLMSCIVELYVLFRLFKVLQIPMENEDDKGV